MRSQKKYVLNWFNYLIALQSIARLCFQYPIIPCRSILWSILVRIWVYLAYSVLKYKLGYTRGCFQLKWRKNYICAVEEKKWQVRYEDVSDKYEASAMWKNENKISLAKLPFSKYGASFVTCIALVCCNSFFLLKSNVEMCSSLLEKTAGNTDYSIVINLFSLPLCTARLIKQNRIVSKLSVSSGKTPVFLIHAKNAFPSLFFFFNFKAGCQYENSLVSESGPPEICGCTWSI